MGGNEIMLKEENRFRRRIILVVLILAGLLFMLLTKQVKLYSFYDCNNQSSEYKDFQFNLLSFSAILAGFMFTALSLLISVGDNKGINDMKKLKLWDTIHRTLIIGI